MNLLRGKAGADYLNTGEWSKKAIKEAKKFGSVNVVASSEDKNFSYAPAQRPWKLDPNAAYVHYTPNETIGGVEIFWTPETGNVPLVADMSSTILSRPIDVSQFGLIYAGAQKNIGPAGLTIVIVRDDLIGQAVAGTPTMFDYKTHADNDSMYNTPPTYGMYIAGLVFQWLKKRGGLAAMEKINYRKSQVCCMTTLDSDQLLPFAGGEGQPFADEHPVHPERCRAGRGLPQGRQGARPAAAEGPPLGGRHARLDLQRDADRRRDGAGRLHE